MKLAPELPFDLPAIIVAMDKRAATGVLLTDDLTDEAAVPYFLWDNPMSLGELRHRLDGSEEARVHLLGKILREARDRDVWLFATPEEVVRRFDQLAPYLGRRLDFWKFILCQWRELGLIRFEDPAPQLEAKRIIDEVVLDSPREILVNKLCALLSRNEPRDLFDVMRLEASGLDLIEACRLAVRKDGGFSPAQLA